MRNMKQKQSIASKCSAFTAGLVILQSLLVLGMLIAGGILKQTRDTAYRSFASTVTLRASSIQDQIDNRWTNIHPYVQELSDRLSESGYGEGKMDAESFLIGLCGYPYIHAACQRYHGHISDTG